MNATKQRAGQLGGLATFERHGRAHMQTIGRRGAITFWQRYRLAPVGVSGWSLIDRKTGEVRSIWGALPWLVLCLALILASCSLPTAVRQAVTPSPLAPAAAATVDQVRPIRAELSPTPGATMRAPCIVSTGLQAGTVNVRSGPGMSYPVVDVAREGETLLTLGEPVNGWQRVCTPRLVEGYFYAVKWCQHE